MKELLPLLSAFERAAQDALVEHVGEVMARSAELAPRDSGDMVESASIKVEDLTVTGGYADFVARLQHENLDYEHPNGGQAKFLETASEELKAKLGPTIQRHLREVFGGG